MSGLYKVFLSEFDALDAKVIKQCVVAHLNDVQIIDDKDTADICLDSDIINPRVGAILDTLETLLFNNRFQNPITYKNYTLNWSKSELLIDDNLVTLSDRERDLMIELLNFGDIGCTRTDLLNKIWGYKTDLETHALETQIYRLRQKIEMQPDKPTRLITIENGYKLA